MKNIFTFNGNIEDKIDDFKVFLDSFEVKKNIKIKFIVDSTFKISQVLLALKPIQELLDDNQEMEVSTEVNKEFKQGEHKVEVTVIN